MAVQSASAKAGANACSDATHEIICVAAELVRMEEIPHPDDKRPTRGEVRDMMQRNCKRASRLKKASDKLTEENKRLRKALEATKGHLRYWDDEFYIDALGYVDDGVR